MSALAGAESATGKELPCRAFLIVVGVIGVGVLAFMVLSNKLIGEETDEAERSAEAAPSEAVQSA